MLLQCGLFFHLGEKIRIMSNTRAGLNYLQITPFCTERKERVRIDFDIKDENGQHQL
jgi:hypothetical protein